MRDIFLMTVFAGLMAWGLRKHHVLLMVWVWLSLMNPHRLTFSFAYDFPFAYISALAILLVFPFSKERHAFPKSTPSTFLILFYVWVGVTSLASFNTPADVFEMWLKVTKIQLILFIMLTMLMGRKQIDILIWVIAISIGFFGFKGGIFTISSGGSSMVMGPSGSFIESTNHIALAMVMVVPLMYYLAKTNTNQFVRFGLYAAMALTTLSVFGTTSRGALLAVCAMVAFLGIKSGRAFTTTAIAAIVLVGLASIMSDQWLDKMGTISTHEDHSAQSRLYTWKMIWNMVLDHPLTGGGFQVTENPMTWQVYAVTEWLRAYSPHSIYFQALAEHGFVGLFLYLGIGISAYRLAGSVASRAKAMAQDWAVLLMGMVQASLVGFAVGGAFVNLVNFDLPYYFVALVILVDQVIRAMDGKGAVVPSQNGPLVAGGA